MVRGGRSTGWLDIMTLHTEIDPSSNTIKSIDEVPERALRAAQPFDRRGRGRTCEGLTDEEWAIQNLRRCDEDYIVLDLANVMRVLERHPDFTGRFHYDKNMHKVIDNGVTMVVWQVDALAAELQERFLAGVNEQLVHKAVDVVANKASLGMGVK